MSWNYHVLDVFTDRAGGGNPLAVFPEADGLDEARMQAIATELNLSETVFCFPPETPEGTTKVRIFTPQRELPFAGHPTVGTAFLLADLGRVPLSGGTAELVLEEGVGPVSVTVRGGGRPETATLSVAMLPDIGPDLPRSLDVAELLGLDPTEAPSGQVMTASCGVPFVIIPVLSREALRHVKVDIDLWRTHFGDGWWATDLYIIYMEEPASEQIDARMFAPSMGIGEDPATGSAAAALAGYLQEVRTLEDGTHRWTVRQGEDMGRPSTLFLEADVREGEISAVRVGGACVRTEDKTWAG